MPLKCLDNEGNAVLAFDYDRDGFEQLRAEHRRRRHLHFDCCDASVVLRVSPLGTQHFAHKNDSTSPLCAAKRMTEDHLRIVTQVALAARANGWNVEVEAVGETSGEAWRADVLATKGGERVAIEVQWSPQTWEQTLERQRRYAAAGVRCIWLFRSTGYEQDRKTPAFHVERGEEGYVVLISPPEDAYRGRNATVSITSAPQWVPIQRFIGDALAGRLEWAPAVRRLLQASLGMRSVYSCRCGQPVWAPYRTISLSAGLQNHATISWSEVPQSPWAAAILRVAQEKAGLQLPVPGQWSWRCSECGSSSVRQWRECSEAVESSVVFDLRLSELPRCAQGSAEWAFVNRWWINTTSLPECG